jgi:predicted  nucleic acid-binding Zn-ribbon protein
MDWKLGDTEDLKKWIENLAGVSAERKIEISDLRNEIYQVKQSLDGMQKKLDNIERILKGVAE